MRGTLWGAALVLGSLLGSCNNPISGAVNATASDTTPFGNGQTVYVAFPDTDWYHTGVLKYASNGTGWIQQLSGRVAVSDINVDSSGNVALVEAGTVLYKASGSTWTSATLSGASGVSLQGSTLLALTGSAVQAYTTSNSPSTLTAGSSVPFTNPTGFSATGSSTAYVGTSNKVYLYSAGTVLPNSPSASISGVYASGTNVYAVSALGLSASADSGGTWPTNATSSVMGTGTPLCVWSLGTSIYVGGTQGVSVSTNSGSTWTPGLTIRSGDQTYQANLGLAVTSISAATAGGDTCIYMATSQGLYVYSYANQSVTVAFSGSPINKVFVTVP